MKKQTFTLKQTVEMLSWELGIVSNGCDQEKVIYTETVLKKLQEMMDDFPKQPDDISHQWTAEQAELWHCKNLRNILNWYTKWFGAVPHEEKIN